MFRPKLDIVKNPNIILLSKKTTGYYDLYKGLFKVSMVRGAFLLFLVFCSSFGSAQNSNFSTSFGEKLIQISIQNDPKLNSLINEAKEQLFQIQIKKVSLLNNLSFVYNYNQYNQLTFNNPGNFISPPVYPRYNLSLTIPLGYFFTHKKEVQSLKKIYDLRMDKIYSYKDEIRQNVLDRYNTYLEAREANNIVSRVAQDSKKLFEKNEKNFKENKLDYVEYIRFQDEHLAILVDNIRKKQAYNIAKYDLERLLGTKLENIPLK